MSFVRVIFSKKVEKLEEEVRPYFHTLKGLDPDAPDEIKKKHIELCRLIDEEYAAAGGIVF